MDTVPEIPGQLIHKSSRLPPPPTVLRSRRRGHAADGIVGAHIHRARAGGRVSAAALDQAVDHQNEVYLVGRLSGEPLERALPSGDVLLSWRLVVHRSAGERGASKAVHDTLPCFAVKAGVRRSVASWSSGDVVEVEGVLRRHFWRAPGGGQASKCEVEARSVKRLQRAAKSSAKVE
jgi:single-strand DNA-binding protein